MSTINHVPLSTPYIDNLWNHGATTQHLHSIENPEFLKTGENSGIEYSVMEGWNGAKDKIFYVPGFSENPVSNAPLAITMANYGFDVILPGHYTGPVQKNDAGKRDALQTRADHYSAILDKVSAGDPNIHFVTHSMGNLVLQKMIEKAIAQGDGRFEGSRVAMLAPSGISASDSIFKMAPRNMRNMKTEKARPPQQFNDVARDMEKSCNRYMLSSPKRTIRELWELAKKSAFKPEVFKQAGVARIALAGYANDPIYPDAHIDSASGRLTELGVDTVYVTPVKIGLPHNTATHNDEQSNPQRVAPLVKLFLREA